MNATASRLEYLRAHKIGDCTRCILHRNRTRIVFGEGRPDADIMLVGEAPGYQEDISGRPFVGPAGKLLTAWIEAVGLRRGEVYIANVVKCRPLDNRDPYPQEKEACSPFLHTQIFLVRPRVLVALGRHAANGLARTNIAMRDLRGVDLRYRNEKTDMDVPVVATYHPSYVLRKGRGEPEREALADLHRALSLAGLSAGHGG